MAKKNNVAVSSSTPVASNTIPIGAAVLVNLAYPNKAPGVYAEILGSYNGDLIFGLDQPDSNGNRATVLPDEPGVYFMLPEKSQPNAQGAASGKRGYDNSFREVKNVLKDLAVEPTRNSDKNSKHKFKVFGAPSLIQKAGERLTTHGYTWDVVSEAELHCTPTNESEAAPTSVRSVAL